MLPDSSAILIIAIIRLCIHTVHVSKSIVKNSEPNAFSRFFLGEFVYDTRGVALVAPKGPWPPKIFRKYSHFVL